MKPALIIGSTCVDLILTIDRLPKTGDDFNPSSQTMSIGGCAYNVAHMLRLLNAEHTFVTPVGGGLFGDYTKKHFEQMGIPVSIYLPEQESGCCYCLVEKSGERTFLSYHGVEYTFKEEWMKDYPADNYGWTYICGLEIEEPTGWDLITYLEKHPNLQICYAPGPRAIHIEKEKTERLYRLHPMLHINEREAMELSGEADCNKAARKLQEKTGNSVIITLGQRGAYCLEKDGSEYLIPGEKVELVIDTIGAGDAHIGTVLACLTREWTLRDAISYANRVSAAVIGVQGATLSADKLPG
ncbi:MAG: carbohydrate kinase family protein [Lachnospiraceae bacterium]|nr:carbohydrate kinase family protein [Lachnospiraceae bacterium]